MRFELMFKFLNLNNLANYHLKPLSHLLYVYIKLPILRFELKILYSKYNVINQFYYTFLQKMMKVRFELTNYLLK